jgi:hypothetical protein
VAAYHKGYTQSQRKEVDRRRKSESREAQRRVDVRTKEVIVWDGEGMKLSGDDAPQHYVLFGCSAEPDSPLIITDPIGNLDFKEIADYCLNIAIQHPNAVHFGYFFKYDQNMIIRSLPWSRKQKLYSDNTCRIKYGDDTYYIRLIPGKFLRITRLRGEVKNSILIEDFAPFFATSFVKAYETLINPPTDPENWAVVVQGKKERSDMLYPDLAKVFRYWRAEIIALQELAFDFRAIMFNADFMLTEWHGPGALANYIRRQHDLSTHEYGGKEENMSPAVHEAVRSGYYGGHFEQYKVGYVKGSIYSYDVNSAYPYAFCHIPSLRAGGYWRNTGPIDPEDSQEWRRDLCTSFAIFHVRWRGASDSDAPIIGNRRIQPFPHRSEKGLITYPQVTEGWYWTPEVNMAVRIARETPGAYCEITDGWVWMPEKEEYPWEDIFREMYTRRRRLKDNGNPTQMAFKLGLNSMYGKMAQRAGGKIKAPQSHTLPIAGYVTSYCRAMVMELMHACKPGSVISVETDGVYTTTAPNELRGHFPLSKELGEWEFKRYDNMVIVQNGVYLLQNGDEWLPPKSRGIPIEAVKVDKVLGHLQKCRGDSWEKMEFKQKENFVGLGTAIARSTRRNYKNQSVTDPAKARRLHCMWIAQPREIDIEGRGSKRAHYPRFCDACRRGESAAESAHDMVIRTTAFDPEHRESKLYDLPWMKEYVAPEWHLAKEADAMILEED